MRKYTVDKVGDNLIINGRNGNGKNLLNGREKLSKKYEALRALEAVFSSDN